ncbi:MAG: hypothetical protein ACRD1X_12370 [Vicinamibacteria bacterium]
MLRAALFVLPLALMGSGPCAVVSQRHLDEIRRIAKAELTIQEIQQAVMTEYHVKFELKRNIKYSIYVEPLCHINLLVKAQSRDDAIAQATKYLTDVLQQWALDVAFVYDAQLQMKD